MLLFKITLIFRITGIELIQQAAIVKLQLTKLLNLLFLVLRKSFLDFSKVYLWKLQSSAGARLVTANSYKYSICT